MNYIYKLLLTLIWVSPLYPVCDTMVCHSATPGGKYAHPSFTNESIKPRSINTEQLELKIKKNPSLKVVNVLGKMLYNDCHIAGSINSPLRFLEEQAKSWNKHEEIVVYCACAECDASLKAYRLLTYLGFTNVWEYDEGIREWFQKGKPVEGPCKDSYLHTKTCKQ